MTEDTAPLAPPLDPLHSAERSELAECKAGNPLPQWIMSSAQAVPAPMHRNAILAHMGCIRLLMGINASRMRCYPSSHAAWMRLCDRVPPADLHDRPQVRAALRGMSAYVRMRLSFALMFDVAFMAIHHEQWQRRKQQAFIRTRLSFVLLFDVAKMAASHHQWLRRKQQGAGRL